MKIAHLGAWNRNMGDWVLGDALHSEFERIAGEKIEWNLVDSQKTLFDDKTIEAINQENDGLLVGGGGLMFWRREDDPISGWQFNIKIEDLRKLTLPWGVFAVGLNVFPYDDIQFPELTPRHLNATVKEADFFSVRNQGSLRGLEKLGVDTSGISIVPDSGMFCGSLVEKKELSIGRPLILINWASDRPHFRYPAPHEENLEKCVQCMAQALKKVVAETKAHVLMVPHIAELDQAVTQTFKEILGADFSSIEETLSHLFPATSAGVGEFLNLYEQADLVIGQRGHAGIMAFGLETPFLYFGNHNKLKYFAEDIENEDCLLSFHNENDYDREKIYQKTMLALEGKIRPGKELRHFQKISDSYIESILESFNSGGNN